jgi:hypothetical protein
MATTATIGGAAIPVLDAGLLALRVPQFYRKTFEDARAEGLPVYVNGLAYFVERVDDGAVVDSVLVRFRRS